MAESLEIVIQGRDGFTPAARTAGAALSNLSGQAEVATRHMGGLSSILKTAAGTALGFAAANVGMRAVSGIFGQVKGAIIGMNASLEKSTLQFETLMGNADQAKAHVKALFDFAKATPFETGPIIEASRMLQTFGGAALNSMENITLMGDAAAAVNAPINELGFWFGRLYSSIQAGRPFGEAAMRLSELAVLSPQARARMEELQEAGASADEVWKTFTDDMGKFTGAMKRQAGTWEGLTSTFRDTLAIVASTAMKPFFDLAKRGLEGLNKLLGTEGVAKAAQGASEAIASGLGRIISVLSKLSGHLSFVGKAFGEVGGFVRELIPYFKAFTQYIRFVVTEGDTLNDFLADLPRPIAVVARAFGEMINFVRELIPHIVSLGERAWPVIRDAFASFIATVGPALVTYWQALLNLLLTVGPAIMNLGRALAGALLEVAQWVVHSGLLHTALVGLKTIYEGLAAALDFLGPILAKIINFIAEHKIVLFALIAALGALLIILNPIPAAILGIVLAVGYLAEHWDAIKGKTLEVWGVISGSVMGAAHLVRDTVVGVFSGIKDFLSANWQEIASIAALLFLGPLGLTVLFATNAFGIRDKVIEAFSSLRDGVLVIFDFIRGGIIGAWDAVTAGVKGSINALIGAVEGGLNAILRGVAAFVSALKAGIDAFPGGNPFGGAMTEVISRASAGVGIPRLEAGGIVRQPTLALVGERGPEAVVPLGRSMEFATVNVYIQAPVYGVDHLEDVVVAAVTLAQRRGRL